MKDPESGQGFWGGGHAHSSEKLSNSRMLKHIFSTSAVWSISNCGPFPAPRPNYSPPTESVGQPASSLHVSVWTTLLSGLCFHPRLCLQAAQPRSLRYSLTEGETCEVTPLIHCSQQGGVLSGISPPPRQYWLKECENRRLLLGHSRAHIDHLDGERRLLWKVVVTEVVLTHTLSLSAEADEILCWVEGIMSPAACLKFCLVLSPLFIYLLNSAKSVWLKGTVHPKWSLEWSAV